MKGHFLLLALFFASLFLIAVSPITNTDIWFNLKSGEFIWENQQIPSEDIFSFTKEGAPWINRLWGFQVVLHLLFSAFSWEGLIFFKAFLFCLTYFLIFFPYRRHPSLPIFLTIGITSILLANYRMMVRPEIVSYFFLVLTFFILDRYIAHNDKNIIWLLPITMLLWVNMHSFYLIGLILIVLVLIAFCVDHFHFRDLHAYAKLKFLLIIFFLCLLALLGNPFGLQGILVPLKQFQMLAAGSVFRYIPELSPTFSKFAEAGLSPPLIFFLILFIIGILSFVIAAQSKKFPLFNFLTFLLLFCLSTTAFRNVALFAILSVPIILRNLDTLKISRKYLKKFSFIVFFFCFFLIFSRVNAALADGFFFIYPFGTSTSEKMKMPVSLVNFLEENKISARFFSNDFIFPNYWLWKFGPKEKVFWDGRLEVYGKDIFEDAFSSVATKESFEAFLEKYRIDGLVFSFRASFPSDTEGRLYDRIKEIHADNRWILIYSDTYFITFLKADHPSIINIKN